MMTTTPPWSQTLDSPTPSAPMTDIKITVREDYQLASKSTINKAGHQFLGALLDLFAGGVEPDSGR